MELLSAIQAADRGDRDPLIMGIVNVTPDSFSDGGKFFTSENAIKQASHLYDGGADLLDLGAESTRPGFTPVSAEEEWRRLAPVIMALRNKNIPLSVDTMKASVARSALAEGVAVINDVWGLQADKEMAATVADSESLVVVMHNRDDINPTLDLWADWRRFFDHSLSLAEKAGIHRERIVFDPGVGFGKTPQQSLWAVQNLGRLRNYYHLPVLLGLSRKSLFGYFLGRETGERLPATLAANLYGARQGAALWRVHDVQAHRDVLRVEALMRETR
ncbi:dihydropteroate synthase [Saccharibacter sp. 17.LH.SD]|uniref:dihydropteroate synthase n=1 Tax=Saccharibacter sp. 17.LH.SD TaxID=2689393 RepID=UPI00136B551A|nr:dihydropteroate synthase [Saccharibacter sp. 17.LH.SD]MXV45075.1 dihydropteroate synthase [Saccharibacter sp. 17.LH.SD]